jgi:HKD family nuclease
VVSDTFTFINKEYGSELIVFGSNNLVKNAFQVSTLFNNRYGFPKSTLKKRISEKLKNALEIERNTAIEDLETTLKKSQNELIGIIVKSALVVIMSVGFITTVMYSFAILSNKDTQIIGSTWSNMFSVLLTNAFSIVGTIMGVKYASETKNNNE